MDKNKDILNKTIEIDGKKIEVLNTEEGYGLELKKATKINLNPERKNGIMELTFKLQAFEDALSSINNEIYCIKIDEILIGSEITDLYLENHSLKSDIESKEIITLEELKELSKSNEVTINAQLYITD